MPKQISEKTVDFYKETEAWLREKQVSFINATTNENVRSIGGDEEGACAFTNTDFEQHLIDTGFALPAEAADPGYQSVVRDGYNRWALNRSGGLTISAMFTKDPVSGKLRRITRQWQVRPVVGGRVAEALIRQETEGHRLQSVADKYARVQKRLLDNPDAMDLDVAAIDGVSAIFGILSEAVRDAGNLHTQQVLSEQTDRIKQLSRELRLISMRRKEEMEDGVPNARATFLNDAMAMISNFVEAGDREAEPTTAIEG